MANIALNKAATAGSSIAPYLPARAVDGLITPLNRWMASGLPTWMGVDLGAVYWIYRWVVKQPGVSGWQSPNYNMSDFKLQGSLDNANWFDMDSVLNNSAIITDRIVTPRQLRYARVYVTRGLRINNNLASIMEFEVYDAANGPYLTNLVPVNWTLSQAFSSDLFAYTVNVASDTVGIQLTPTAPAGMVIKVKGTVVVSGQASQVIPLAGGINPVAVTVKSADNTMTATYTINVLKPPGTQTATLSGILMYNNREMEIIFAPAFNKDLHSYGIGIANAVSSVRVAASTTLPGAGITVNGAPVENGIKSVPLSMTVGSNTITISVSCSGYTTGSYTITVTRAAP
jgi:hypothetical protein